MSDLNFKKIFLYSLIVSVAVSALLGIWVILSGDFGEFQARVLMTTLTVVGTSILGLACGAFFENPKSSISGLKIVPVAGMILAIVSAVLALAMIWQIVGSQNSTVYKTIAITGLFAFTMAQLSLLSLANLSPKFKWALVAVYFVALGLASIISILIMVEPSGESDFILRLIGILGVTDAALTVIIPIFHRLSYGDFAKNKTEIEKIDAEIEKLKSELNDLEQKREQILKTKN